MYRAIRPGKVWYDTNGKRIQAHGGSLLYVDGTFYWYGENKEGITGTATGEKCAHWHHGVRLYSSKDLYNWQDEGVIVYQPNDKTSGFYPENIMDRPHILYNAKTKRYVLWAKVSLGNFNDCFFAVCTSERIQGPYMPCPNVTFPRFHAGDFDLVEDEGKGYVIFGNPHTELVCYTLSEDYTNVTEEYSSHLPKNGPPFAREAPAYFQRNGRKYLLTSGTTGYYPNRTETEEIETFHGEWRTLGWSCRDDKLDNSFHAQFSSVFKHPHIEDLYIAIGDRWLTDLSLELPDMEGIFYRLCNDEAEPLPEDFRLSDYSDENTSEANYVWLPISFDEDGTPYIRWRDTWTVEEFQK